MKKREVSKNKAQMHQKQENTTTIFEKMYFVFFLILPIIYSDKIVDPVLIPRQILLTFFVAILGIVIFYRISTKKLENDFSFFKSVVIVSFFIFLLALLFSFFQSNVLSESIYLFSKVFIEFIFLILTTYLITQNQLTLKRLFRSIFTFVVIICLIAIYQLANLFETGSEVGDLYSINSTIGHKNLFSSILFLSIPFLLNSLFTSPTWKKTNLALILLVVSLLWILQTRAVLIALILFIGTFFGVFLLKNRQKTTSFFTRPILLFLSILFLSLTTFTVLNKEKFSRLFNIDSVIERIAMWKNTIQMVKDHLIFGVGGGNWQVYFPEKGLDKFPDQAVKNGLMTFQRPHNDFLWVFSEIGVVGFIAYLSIFISVIYLLFRLIKKSDTTQNSFLFSTLFATIIGYIFIALIDFPFERIEHQLILLLIFSIILAKHHSTFKSKSDKSTTIFTSIAIPIFLIIAVITSFTVTFNRFKGEKHTHLLYEAHHSSNWNEMIKQADLAQNNYYKLDATSIPIYWYKGVAEFSLGNSQQAKSDFSHAQRLTPYNIHVLNNLGTCYANLGKTKKAIECFQKVLSISPSFEESILNLSGLYFNIHEYENAYLTIIQCNPYSVDPKYIQFLYPILIEKLNLMLLKEVDPSKIEKIKKIKSNYDDLMKLFLDCKRNNINFEKYILKH